MRTILVALLAAVFSIANGQARSDLVANEGQIHVTMDMISQRGVEPIFQKIVFKFIGGMMLESIVSIHTTESGNGQTQKYVPKGYMVINTMASAYYKVDTLTCNAKALKSGELKAKKEGMLFNEQMDLFAGPKEISVLPDSVVDGISYKRFQVNTTDPSTKKKILVIAHAVAKKKNKLPISLSTTLEKKYSCSITFLDVHFAGMTGGFVRKRYNYVPYRLSDTERRVLACFSKKKLT